MRGGRRGPSPVPGPPVDHTQTPAPNPACPQIRTVLTTESTKGMHLTASGRRLVGNSGVLVGTATVEKVGDMFMDTFLQLPNDALAVMSCDFVFE